MKCSHPESFGKILNEAGISGELRSDPIKRAREIQPQMAG